jgi:hypothetical protein
VKIPYFKFHENPSGGSRSVPSDKQGEGSWVYSRFSQIICENAPKPGNKMTGQEEQNIFGRVSKENNGTLYFAP